MYLFLHLIINIDNFCTNDIFEDINDTNCNVKELGYIITDRNFEIIEQQVVEIENNNEIDEEVFLHFLKNISMVITFEANLTISILKRCLFLRNMHKIIEVLNTKCFYEIRSNLKSVVKKLSRYGILYPSIHDVSIFCNCGEYIDSDSSEKALNVIHACCSKLYREKNLRNFDIVLKKHEEKGFVKSFTKILSFQSLGNTLFTN
jgi:hypothetical protein